IVPDARRLHPPLGTIDVVLAPLMRRRIVQEDRGPLPMTVGSVGPDLLDPPLPVPYRPRDLRSAHVCLLVRLVERVLDDRDLGRPAAEREVKIVCAVARARRGLRE